MPNLLACWPSATERRASMLTLRRAQNADYCGPSSPGALPPATSSRVMHAFRLSNPRPRFSQDFIFSKTQNFCQAVSTSLLGLMQFWLCLIVMEYWFESERVRGRAGEEDQPQVAPSVVFAQADKTRIRTSLCES